jgi:hypothetical protein
VPFLLLKTLSSESSALYLIHCTSDDEPRFFAPAKFQADLLQSPVEALATAPNQPRVSRIMALEGCLLLQQPKLPGVLRT